MPAWDFICENGHKTWELFVKAEEVTDRMICPECGLAAYRQLAFPNTKVMWDLPPIDNADDVWGGTRLEGTDGINPYQYKSTKTQIDFGKE